MAGYQEIYVAPVLNSDTGAGTLGDPYGDLEYGIRQTTKAASGGTRVNVRDDGMETLVASLETAFADTSVTPAWVSSETSPIILQGYTSAAGDGGLFDISGGDLVSIINTADDYIHIIDGKAHNTGANDPIDVGVHSQVHNVEVYNATGSKGIDVSTGSSVTLCHVHDVNGTGIVNFGYTAYNFVENGITGALTSGILGNGGFCLLNKVSVSGSAEGIRVGQTGSIVCCSIFSDGGTGQGIDVIGNQVATAIINNMIEGFSGAGGIGVKYLGDGATNVKIIGGNRVFNCTTEFAAAARDAIVDLGGDEILTASPFVDAANGDFTPVAVVGSGIKEGHLPALLAS